MSHLTCNAHCNTDFDWTRMSFHPMVSSRHRSVTTVWRDNRTLCWNPQTLQIINKVFLFYFKLIDIIPNIVTTFNNWVFQISRCPRNPELLTTPYLDSTIGIHTPQSTNSSVGSRAPVPSPSPMVQTYLTSLDFLRPRYRPYHSHKWLRRPVSSSFMGERRQRRML